MSDDSQFTKIEVTLEIGVDAEEYERSSGIQRRDIEDEIKTMAADEVLTMIPCVKYVRIKDEKMEADKDDYIKGLEIALEPLLGLATTEEIFRELIARLTFPAREMPEGYSGIAAVPYAELKAALILSEMLGGLSASTREYRTVDQGGYTVDRRSLPHLPRRYGPTSGVGLQGGRASSTADSPPG